LWLSIIACVDLGVIQMNKLISRSKLFISILAGLTLTCSLFMSAGSAFALEATSTDMPLYFLRSADCTGEMVEISGTIHMVNQIQADGSAMGHFNYQNVRGLGLTSGNIYQTPAVDHIRLSAPFPTSITSVRSFLLISRGSSSNLLIHVAYHITINENGKTTAFIEDLDVQCT
jgi:hypothetical protein